MIGRPKDSNRIVLIVLEDSFNSFRKMRQNKEKFLF